jgi:hypothetical protein
MFAVWPIIHAPTLMQAFHNPLIRHNPSFVALVASICCLSSRYAQHPLLSQQITSNLLAFANKAVRDLSTERADLYLVQALFNMSVVQEGTSQPSLLWNYLSSALS